jgi:hypothetical protein
MLNPYMVHNTPYMQYPQNPIINQTHTDEFKRPITTQYDTMDTSTKPYSADSQCSKSSCNINVSERLEEVERKFRNRKNNESIKNKQKLWRQ